MKWLFLLIILLAGCSAPQAPLLHSAEEAVSAGAVTQQDTQAFAQFTKQALEGRRSEILTYGTDQGMFHYTWVYYDPGQKLYHVYYKKEGEEAEVSEYKYLIHPGDGLSPSRNTYIPDSWVLVNAEDLNSRKLGQALFSSQSSDFIDHFYLYSGPTLDRTGKKPLKELNYYEIMNFLEQKQVLLPEQITADAAFMKEIFKKTLQGENPHLSISYDVTARYVQQVEEAIRAHQSK